MLALASAFLSALSGAAAAPVADTVPIREWNVPWADTRPRDPAVGADGRVWFVGQVGNYLAVLDPTSGDFRRFELPERALPHNVVVGPDGALWYAGNGDSHVGRLDPATGQVKRFPMPNSLARDPHTLVFGKGGELWFTVQGGNFVGRMTPDGTVRLLSPSVRRARPYGIALDPSGAPWVALFGTNRVARVDPATMRMREYTLPAADARPRRIEVTPDGMVWYVDHQRGTLGRLDPPSGEVREWPAPGGATARPYALAQDDRGRLWFVETGSRPNRLVGFDPATGTFLDPVALPSGGRSVRHMVFHPRTRALWFGTDAGTIGRAMLP